MFTRVVLVTVLAVLAEVAARSRNGSRSSKRARRRASSGSPHSLASTTTTSSWTWIRQRAHTPYGRADELAAARPGDRDSSKLVEESNERARSEGVADRVRFEHGTRSTWT